MAVMKAGKTLALTLFAAAGIASALAGCTKEDVVLCRLYIPDVAAWDAVNAVYAAFFGAHKPARVIVPTRELHHGARIEIEAIAEVR